MRELAVSVQAQRALLKLLVKLGFIEPADCAHFPDKDSCPIAYYSRGGRFDEARVISAVGDALGIKPLVVDKHSLARLVQTLEHPAFASFDMERWRMLRAVPVEINGKSIVVAMANPLDHDARNALSFDLGREVQIVIAPEARLLAVLAHKMNSTALFELDSMFGAGEGNSESAVSDVAKQESSVFQGDASSAPVIRLVNKIFSDAVQAGASDIHLTPEKDKVAVKARVDGIVQPLFDIPMQAQSAALTRIKLLCGMDIAERRKPQDGRLRIKTAMGVKDLRVSVVPTVHGENVVARILSSDLTLATFDSLGVPPDMEARFRRALSGSSRVVLVTGPTGSGKTSTLYAGLLHLHDGQRNIITIEDPIEYRIAGINQVQVNPKIGLGFAETLRSVLRQDPDVIMVGEVRDRETASIAMQVAQTGHLVLSTLHTNTAPAAITRLRDLGVPSFLIASSIGSVVAQRLVRRLCDCSVPASDEDRRRAREIGLDETSLRSARGCEKCSNTGYRGRVGIFSFLEVNDSVAEAIRSEQGEAEIAARAAGQGYQSLERAGMELISAGVTTIAEVERVLGAFAAAPASATAGAILTAAPVRGAQAIQRPKVLLVEDEENTRTVLSLLLQREHFDVIEAGDGQAGIAAVYEHAPELIVCDLMMPKLSGSEMVQKLKNDTRTRHIPVLVLTAADDEQNELQLIGSGADDFVSKTSDAKIMVARVHRLLERSAARVR